MTNELIQLKDKIEKEGRTLRKILGEAESNLKQEFYIAESDL